jgi:CheY-like chemotaxis protein
MAVTEISHGAYAGASVDLVQNLLEEFLAETAERLSELEKRAGEGLELSEPRRFAFEVAGQAHNFSQPLLETVARRMDNYLSAVDTLTGRREDLLAFLACMADILDGAIPADADPALVVRSLPARPSSFDAGEIEVRDVEVMLVMLHGAQTHFVEREMQACGYRVTIVTSTVQALDQAVRTRPDMVIISAVMPGLSGIDLTVALTAMPETRNIPVALITSLEPGNEALGFLPDRVPIIRKGPSFGDDLAAALSYHFLL